MRLHILKAKCWWEDWEEGHAVGKHSHDIPRLTFWGNARYRYDHKFDETPDCAKRLIFFRSWKAQVQMFNFVPWPHLRCWFLSLVLSYLTRWYKMFVPILVLMWYLCLWFHLISDVCSFLSGIIQPPPCYAVLHQVMLWHSCRSIRFAVLSIFVYLRKVINNVCVCGCASGIFLSIISASSAWKRMPDV